MSGYAEHAVLASIAPAHSYYQKTLTWPPSPISALRRFKELRQQLVKKPEARKFSASFEEAEEVIAPVIRL